MENNTIIINGWIARNKNKKLYLYPYVPPLRNASGYSNIFVEQGRGCCRIDRMSYQELFPEITWDNSPMKAKIMIEIEEDEEWV